MYLDYRDEKDFIGMDMCRKFLEMGFTRARRYANHNSGRKYKKGTKKYYHKKKIMLQVSMLFPLCQDIQTCKRHCCKI